MALRAEKRVYNGKFAVGVILNDGRQVLDTDLVRFIERGGVVFGLGVSGGKVVGAHGRKLSDLPTVNMTKEVVKSTGAITDVDKAIAPSVKAYKDFRRIYTQLSTVLCGSSEGKLVGMDAPLDFLLGACLALVGRVDSETSVEARDKIIPALVSTFSVTQLFGDLDYVGKQRVTNINSAVKNLVSARISLMYLGEALSTVLHKGSIAVESLDSITDSIQEGLSILTHRSVASLYDIFSSKKSTDAVVRSLMK